MRARVSYSIIPHAREYGSGHYCTELASRTRCPGFSLRASYHRAMLTEQRSMECPHWGGRHDSALARCSRNPGNFRRTSPDVAKPCGFSGSLMASVDSVQGKRATGGSMCYKSVSVEKI